jgi:hypothetical protein
MDFMVYVPDTLGMRIKAAKANGKLNYSRLFQEAAQAELERLERLAEMADDPQEFELEMRTPDGIAYMGVIRGEQLTKAHKGCTFYLTTDGRVLAHYEDGAEGEPGVVPIENAGLASGYASTDDYIKVSAALGESPRVEL